MLHICYNCDGFGYTIGPVMQFDDEGNQIVEENNETDMFSAIYPCGACDSIGYITTKEKK